MLGVILAFDFLGESASFSLVSAEMGLLPFAFEPESTSFSALNKLHLVGLGSGFCVLCITSLALLINSG